MAKRTILKVLLYICISLVVIFALTIGISVGAAIAEVKNTIANENFMEFDPALPSKVVDINGRVITQFYSDEKREIVSIKELPQHLIDAVITREDQSFWKHHGFTLRGYFRALLGILLRKNMGGGSTITLQLAGTLYANRREISLKRKLVELWWALQLERRYTKEEILEMYLNRMIMGPGVYGVEAAS
ncbi:MAG TPA: transglycosylase domain-containing protein, partial [Spirochaetales bacterium]|nr:transglycosylase domain-containing protein [Spirochaetales bacterium]